MAKSKLEGLGDGYSPLSGGVLVRARKAAENGEVKVPTFPADIKAEDIHHLSVYFDDADPLNGRFCGQENIANKAQNLVYSYFSAFSYCAAAYPRLISLRFSKRPLFQEEIAESVFLIPP